MTAADHARRRFERALSPGRSAGRLSRGRSRAASGCDLQPLQLGGESPAGQLAALPAAFDSSALRGILLSAERKFIPRPAGENSPVERDSGQVEFPVVLCGNFHVHSFRERKSGRNKIPTNAPSQTGKSCYEGSIEGLYRGQFGDTGQ